MTYAGDAESIHPRKAAYNNAAWPDSDVPELCCSECPFFRSEWLFCILKIEYVFETSLWHVHTKRKQGNEKGPEKVIFVNSAQKNMEDFVKTFMLTVPAWRVIVESRKRFSDLPNRNMRSLH
jgi:hypothetical protein